MKKAILILSMLFSSYICFSYDSIHFLVCTQVFHDLDQTPGGISRGIHYATVEDMQELEYLVGAVKATTDSFCQYKIMPWIDFDKIDTINIVNIVVNYCMEEAVSPSHSISDIVYESLVKQFPPTAKIRRD